MNTAKQATNSNSKPMKTPAVNDIGFRLILIPFLGIAIPLATGLVDHSTFTHWQIKFSYLYTILLEGNHLIVRNNLNKINRQRHTSGIGLQNLSARYQLITNERMVAGEKPGSFSVSLPLLNI